MTKQHKIAKALMTSEGKTALAKAMGMSSEKDFKELIGKFIRRWRNGRRVSLRNLCRKT